MDFNKIETKWQKKWEKEKVFEVSEKSKKPKCYVLEMYPYPSGRLHMGHAFNYTIGDIQVRFKRMKGFNVLYPMGYDSFGLPAENASIKAKSHPKKFTEEAIDNFVKQQKALGLSYDWQRKLMSHDPEYYKWNQYLFLKFLEKGLIYRKKAPVNFCPKCDTVLANEQVHNGKCWRHIDTEVEQKELEQWFIKTTEYADELLNCIDDLKWPERIKTMQRNWIGKSEGVNILFPLENSDKILSAFTTRCDTIFSVTFLAIAPESPLVNQLISGTKHEKSVKEFVKKILRQKVEDRINEDKEKEGIFIGKYAINPTTKEKIPIYVSNFALMYGTGVVMCDAHDKRDFRFARKYDIPLKFVISNGGERVDANKAKEAYTDDGVLFDSGEFSGMNNQEALPKMAKWLEKNKLGEITTQYRLKDWLVSRQRYWGTPIPIIYCDKCGIVPVNEKDLPVKLPEKVKFGKGNPLETAKTWLKVKCPKCGKIGNRETDTMDTFFDSSWYYLRYCDNKNNKQPFDKKKTDYWMPVDYYIGGAEHACMHLIYARFFTKALRDMKFLKFDEPFAVLFNQGMVHGSDGSVMSKSRGNGADPLETIEKFSADILRFYLVSTASPDNDFSWSDKAIQGSYKFINKVVEYFQKIKLGKTDDKIQSKLNKTIKVLTEDIENFKYNLAVIRLRELFDSFNEETISKEDAGNFLKLLHPFCPHIAEELWEKIGNKGFISLADWPKADEKKINEKFEQEDKAVEKLKEDIANIKKITGKEKSKIYVYVLPQEKEIYSKVEDIKVFAVNDKNKYDPEGKAGKAKPGKPAIYLE